jgi:tRNA pseudouridine55 synthase
MEFEVNNIKTDEFGRPHGILILNKPVGITSHDLVDETRRKYKTRKVGHAGTLDPFASGKMIVLLGKATKLSDSFLGLDKEYVADIAFGISTRTGDVEGELKIAFPKEYVQYVPVFSSVKIKGRKLRELARSSDSFEIADNEEGKKTVKFLKNDVAVFEAELPFKLVKLYEMELLEIGLKDLDIYRNEVSKKLLDLLNEEQITKLLVARIRVKCSKGTYIRQLAEDIGEKLHLPAFLLSLERTAIGQY